MQKRDRKYKVQRSCEKYNSYDPNVWSLEFFDEKTGGYVVVNRKRKANAVSHKNEGGKYEKEFAMVKAFACGGHQIEMLEEFSRIPSPDVTIDGVPAEIKCMESATNMERYARKATRRQGARIVLFRFDKMTARIVKNLKTIQEAGIHGKYYIVESREICDF